MTSVLKEIYLFYNTENACLLVRETISLCSGCVVQTLALHELSQVSIHTEGGGPGSTLHSSPLGVQRKSNKTLNIVISVTAAFPVSKSDWRGGGGWGLTCTGPSSTSDSLSLSAKVNVGFGDWGCFTAGYEDFGPTSIGASAELSVERSLAGLSWKGRSWSR